MNCEVEYGTAAFKGLKFESLPVDNSGGQRLTTHTYPFTDFHYNEKFGRKPEAFKVRGFFVGDDFRDKLKVAKRIWGTTGSGVYFEPTENKRHSVDLVDWRFKFKENVLNYVEFDLTFIEASDNPYPNQTLGIFGQINGIIDDFIDTVSGWHYDIIAGAGQVTDIFDAFNASTVYLSDTVRMNVSSGYTTAITPLNNLKPSKIAQVNVDSLVGVYESASDASAPLAFFRQSSELVINGDVSQSGQGQLFALLGLAYYFERIAEGVDYAELANFRERATSLKTQVGDERITHAVDGLIQAAGAATTHIPTFLLEGQHNALVASFGLYGNVSRASDILEASFGVSGVKLDRVLYT